MVDGKQIKELLMKNYPALGEFKRLPDQRDGFPNIGKPCIVCETNTLGSMFIQVDYMRGNDELVRVCSSCKIAYASGCKGTNRIIESYLGKQQ